MSIIIFLQCKNDQLQAVYDKRVVDLVTWVILMQE